VRKNHHDLAGNNTKIVNHPGKQNAMLAATYSLLCATLVGWFVVFNGSGIFPWLVSAFASSPQSHALSLKLLNDEKFAHSAKSGRHRRRL
jgi:Kef-type K+ transport system membrane component KefB